MATESTEEHEKINALQEIFPCSCVDSVAINKFSHNLRGTLSWGAKEFRIASGGRLDICLPEDSMNRRQ
jgi:hypothetical protein